MKCLINSKLKVIPILILLLLNGCDNKTKIIDSKDERNKESIKINKEKHEHEKEIDSLKKEIKNLSKTKSNVEQNYEFAEAEIFSILKKSYLDHIIIGTHNLESTREFLVAKLGFKVSAGRVHKNGISNFFIEFKDSSEIEFMSINNSSDQLSQQYKQMIDDGKFGLQFALRTNKLDKLYNQFYLLDPNNYKFNKNTIYSTLSENSNSRDIPIFFIQYNINHNNSIINQDPNLVRLSAVWLGMNKLRETIQKVSNFGFTLIDTTRAANFLTKTALLRNDNSDIILIENENEGILGLTIIVNDLESIHNQIDQKINLDLKIKINNRGRTIALAPEITKSVWIEFLELQN